MKQSKTARRAEGRPRPFTGDVKEAILAGLNAGPDGIQGFLAHVACSDPKSAERYGTYAEYFATQGYGPSQIAIDEAHHD